MSPRSSSVPANQPPAPRGRRFRSGIARDEGATAVPSEINVGLRLRALRTERGLSIRALAEMSGLNFNTLGLIENGKCSPSVSTLQQLAMGLALPITAFFETDAPKNHIAYVRAGQRADAAFAHGTLADLGAGMAERAIEPFVITLDPNMGSGQTPIVHTGHEFVFCLRGRLLYTVADQSYLLAAGDSLLFEAHLPHRWQNVDLETSQALLVLCPADARDQPTALHFALK